MLILFHVEEGEEVLRLEVVVAEGNTVTPRHPILGTSRCVCRGRGSFPPSSSQSSALKWAGPPKLKGPISCSGTFQSQG